MGYDSIGGVGWVGYDSIGGVGWVGYDSIGGVGWVGYDSIGGVGCESGTVFESCSSLPESSESSVSVLSSCLLRRGGAGR